jgi:hypothetical protein
MQALSMFTLAGRLFEGALGTYYRAVGAAGEPVLLFLLRNEPPGPEELARLQQAHALQLELSRAPFAHGTQVLEPLAIVQGADRVGLALRHSDGEPLGQGLRRGALPVRPRCCAWGPRWRSSAARCTSAACCSAPAGPSRSCSTQTLILRTLHRGCGS